MVDNISLSPDAGVALCRQEIYDVDEIVERIDHGLALLGIAPAELFGNKRIAVKPNLLLKSTPDKAATTHPAVLEAVLRIIKRYSDDVIIAESPGGVYNAAYLKMVYNGCGITAAAERANVPLNYDDGFTELHAENARLCKSFNIIEPIASCDVIVNICKLKTHSLSQMTGAVKNYFGTIPGIQKFEMHARFKAQHDFFEMLCDLAAMHCESKRVLNITDAIIGMEGNGPSGGAPKKLGALTMSENPFALDIVNASLIGMDGNIELLELAKKRGYAPANAKDVNLVGERLEPMIVKFKPADSNLGSHLKNIPDFLRPRPKVMKKLCKGCGDCVRSCPVHTIKLKEHKAAINPSKCIKCYCCQELCTFKAIKIKKNFIYSIIK